MELWIRSQDKERIIKTNQLDVMELYTDVDPRYNHFGVYANDYLVGEYKSKERALEILDEIQNILKPMICLRRGNEEHKLLGARQSGITSTLETEFKEVSTYVYEMPKE